jgi:hypothetical protein
MKDGKEPSFVLLREASLPSEECYQILTETFPAEMAFPAALVRVYPYYRARRSHSKRNFLVAIK